MEWGEELNTHSKLCNDMQTPSCNSKSYSTIVEGFLLEEGAAPFVPQSGVLSVM